MSRDTAVTVTDGFTRPEPPYAAPEGYHWEAGQEGPEWGIAEPGKRCRFRGPSERACGGDAAIVVTRGIRRRIPWNYCARDGLERYGRWAENGKVMTWKLKDGPAA